MNTTTKSSLKPEMLKNIMKKLVKARATLFQTFFKCPYDD